MLSRINLLRKAIQMSNYQMAVQWGTKMANQTNNGGLVMLGLIGSGLNQKQINQVFKDINAKVPVKLLSSSVDKFLMMEKI